jgi:hypothetical protein
MSLTPEEKAARRWQRMYDKSREFQISTYVRKFVAPLFQKMVRAEFGADPRQFVTAIVDGEICQVPRHVGECVCVTCGKVDAWNSGIKGIHCGHFIASRRNSILLEEDNVSPQCSGCNYYASGAPQAFRKWMLYVRGEEVVERLERLKTESVSFDREDLVDMRIEYADRLKAAELSMFWQTNDVPF